MAVTHRVTLAAAIVLAAACSRPPAYFQISVVDGATGRGIPLVELTPLNAVRYHTDSNGVVAFLEPHLMGREVYFEVRSHGYKPPRLHDGDMEGVLLKAERGGKATVRMQRINIAERLYRVTGEGIYRDSVLLGLPTPLRDPLLTGQVMGTDGASTAVYRGKLYWFFGDTNGVNNMNFAGAVATSALPGDPTNGVDLEFFVDAKGFAKSMLPHEGGGLVWPFAPMVLPDDSGVERLLVRYDRGAGHDKPKPAERGLAMFNDTKQVFEPLVKWPDDAPLAPEHTPFRVRVNGEEYFYFAGGSPAPSVRVRANWKSVTDPAAYESFTPEHGWRRGAPMPADKELAGVDVETGERLKLRSDSVQWNDYRKRWIMIAQQTGGKSSHLGEVWYLEAPEPVGPWTQARKILSHDRYSFYEIVQHPQFDQEGGRSIYFSGTYSDFLANPRNITPRYDYNLLMYRLDLSDPRLHM